MARLLAVDDDPSNLRMLEVLVEQYLPQCELVTASSGQEGLALVAEQPVAGALVDVNMPGMDGIEVCRQLKADPSTAHTHVILVTAYEATSELKGQGLEAGADDFITKPIGTVEFVAKIRVMLRLIQAEEDLRDIADHLEELVEERTKDLERARAALTKHAEELARSNAELEQFAYVASHDLQEPLRMVASYVQLLEQRYKDKLDSEANEFIEYAVDGALRMQKLIDGLLAYSRVGTRGKEFAPTDTEALLDDVLVNLQVAIEETGAVVTHDPLPTVPADDVQLARVFQNLISNAIKFRSEEPPRVHISAAQDADEWVFSVRDNGIGIDPQHHERIFTLFQRLHTRRQYPGIGVGATIARVIVQRHDGRIWVESEPGKGSTFYFTISTRGEPVS